MNKVTVNFKLSVTCVKEFLYDVLYLSFIRRFRFPAMPHVEPDC